MKDTMIIRLYKFHLFDQVNLFYIQFETLAKYWYGLVEKIWKEENKGEIMVPCRFDLIRKKSL